jgi:hypothetical protein
MNITGKGIARVLEQLNAMDKSITNLASLLKTTDDGYVLNINESGSITISKELYEECAKGVASEELLIQALMTYDAGKYAALKF